MVRTNLQEFAGDVHVLSNLQVGSNLFANDLAANVLSVNGAIGANLFVGDGGLLSNIATTLDDIIDQGNTVSNTIIFVSGNDATSNTGIITYSNVGISISNTAPTGEYQLTVGSNIFMNAHASNVLSVVGRIGADYFVGDGGLLSNIATTLDQIVDQGNTISNTVILESGQDTTSTSNIGLITRENVGISISNSEPSSAFQLTVGDALFVNTYSSNALTVEGNVLAQKLSFGTATVTSAYNLSHVTAQGSTTDQTISLTNTTTGLEVTSNATVGGNVTAQTVISTANVEVGDRLKFSGSNVFVDDLRVADLAANLVTYDKTTGELMDSGGLFANKLAVVSVQPPSALSANTTTVAKHGTYTVTTSSLAANSNAWNAFDGDSAVEWLASTTSDHVYNGGAGAYSGTSNLFAGNYIQTGVSSAGEWLAIEFPYKTTLRHMKLTPPDTIQQYPASANVYATNDSLTWTEVVNWSDVNPVASSNVQTIIVNATEAYKKYAMVVTKTNGSDTNTALGEWKLFAESFSIDGGKVAMASSAVMGGETTMEQSGPHGRGEAKLKKYPEIAFEEGKFDANDSTNTYVQAGYTVTASGVTTNNNIFLAPWKVLDDISDDFSHRWRGEAVYANNESTATPSALDPSSPQTQLDTNTSIGEYLILNIPKKIKLKNIIVNGPHMHMPYEVDIYGKNEGVSTWTHVKKYTYTIPTGTDQSAWNTTNQTIDATEYYSEYAFVVVKTNGKSTPSIGELQLYGYEEDPPAGDISVDTTFTSIMNTPQTTGANVYVDGNLGSAFTNRVTGPTVSNTATSYDSTGKYWTLTGALTSNVTVEANTFLEGDAPHSVSVWFNSSNLEANVSNTCVFSISDQEKLDSVNLDLQSNTWHNLTYAYQGEGGSRVTYLDGRKVAEDQAEDTFGDYPPFAMTGYSQGGYVVSSSTDNFNVNGFYTWGSFDGVAGNGWHGGTGSGAAGATLHYAADAGGSVYDPSLVPAGYSTSIGGIDGEWIKLEMPHKLVVDYVTLKGRGLDQDPKDFKVLGSNDDVNWDILKSFTGVPYSTTGENHVVGATKGYKYIAIVVTRIQRTDLSDVVVSEISYYGHRENDLVRLPDPTRVLKYPHIAMTGPAQRGYVATASSFYNNWQQYAGWNAFNETVDDPDGWVSIAGSYSSGIPSIYSGVTQPDKLTGIDATSSYGNQTERNGSWLKIEVPHKLRLSQMKLFRRHADQRIVDGFIYGSNDNSTFYQISSNLSEITNIGTYSNTTPLVINSTDTTTPFKQFVVQVTKNTTNVNYTNIGNLELYGTEEASQVPIQIGGGNIDKVANFRVYDKFIGEDQALEIWDAQKDEFGRAKSSMTLHKGRLGIGTTEPEGRLAVLDEPHNLEEFPPRAMTGYKNYFEGHGEFCVSASHEYNSTTGFTWRAFDKNRETEWQTNSGFYSSGALAGSGLTTITSGIGAGIWLQIECPYKLSLKKFVYSQRTITNRTIKNGYVVGSNDTITWDIVHKLENIPIGEGYKDYHVPVSNYNFYKYFRLITTEVHGGDRTEFTEWRLFGTREQGQSVLHDGQLTLTKSLNVPRIGPALDADDTPRRDRLVVEYNTSTNPTFEGAVRDTSGRGNDGVLGSGVSYDASEKSLVIDNSTGGFIHRDFGSQISGNFIHSISMWVKGDTFATGNIDVILWIGDNVNNKRIEIYASTTLISYNFKNNQYESSNSVGLTDGAWNHIAFTYNGQTGSAGREIYVNGKLIAASHSGNADVLNITNGNLYIGSGSSPGNGYDLDGSISNFKLYDVALTAEEVKTLYDMGRCDEGHHVVNFSKTRVGIGLGDGEAPTSTLDVRGTFQGNSPLRFYVLEGVHPTTVTSQFVDLPPGCIGSRIVSITGMTFNTNGDGVPFERHSESQWEVDVYYSTYSSNPTYSNKLSLSSQGSSTLGKPWKMFVVTT